MTTLGHGLGEVFCNKKVAFTPEGGLAILMKNRSGAPTVKGSSVHTSTTYDNAFELQTSGFDTIGFVYESGIADGDDCYIVIAGIADVLWKDGETSTRGYVALADDVDGRCYNVAVPSANPVVAEHFREIGHVLESKGSGTNVLVKCIVHFN